MSSVPASIITTLIDVSARYNLANTDFRLLLFLALQEEGRICDSMANLATRMNVPVRTLRRSAARLHSLGLIRREPGRGRIPTCLRLSEHLLATEDVAGALTGPASPNDTDRETISQEVIDTLARLIAQSLPNMPLNAARSLAASHLYAPLATLVAALHRAQQAQVLRVPPGRDVLHAILTQHLAELETRP